MNRFKMIKRLISENPIPCWIASQCASDWFLEAIEKLGGWTRSGIRYVGETIFYYLTHM